jgi:cysteinyl-tRNA synthetase
MAKSKGGFLTLQVLLDAGYDSLDYRYFLLGGHYRSQLQFSYEALDSARSSRKSLMERVLALKEKCAGLPDASASAALGPKAAACLDAFTGHLCQDLATPRALSELWGLLRDAEIPPPEALAAAFKMDEVLGLGLADARKPESKAVDPALAAEIEALVAERVAAKKSKDWARADAIRADLKSKGVLLEDGPAGTIWKLA